MPKTAANLVELVKMYNADFYALFMRAQQTGRIQRTGHPTPNLAAILVAFRTFAASKYADRIHTTATTGGISQMRFGANRDDNGCAIVESADAFLPTNANRSWFSLIANVEQGGRKTDIPAQFVSFLVEMTGIPRNILETAIAEDKALFAAYLASNR